MTPPQLAAMIEFTHTDQGDRYVLELQGSYFESCSCDVVCPCTASSSFQCHPGLLPGRAGLPRRAGRDRGRRCRRPLGGGGRRHAESDERGQLEAGRLYRCGGLGRAGAKARAVFSGSLGGPMSALARSCPRTSGCSGRRSSSATTVCAIRSRSATPSSRDRGRGSVRRPRRAAGQAGGVFHPAGRELTVARATSSKVDAFGIQYEGKSAFSSHSPGRRELRLSPTPHRREASGAREARTRHGRGRDARSSCARRALFALAGAAWWISAVRMGGMTTMGGSGTAAMHGHAMGSMSGHAMASPGGKTMAGSSGASSGRSAGSSSPGS